MKTTKVMILFTALALASAGELRAQTAEPGDKPVKLKQTPAAVQAVVAKLAEGGKLESIAKEDEDGTMQYTAVIKKGSRTIEAAISLKGSLIDTEEGSSLSAAPKAVQKTLTSEAKGGKLTAVEKATAADGTLTYDADITKNGATSEVSVSPEGKVLKTTSEGSDAPKK